MNLDSCEWPLAVIPMQMVEPEAVEAYHAWLARGENAGMEYLANHDDIRTNPALLMEGARSMIMVALPYFTESKLQLPFSLYARGRDYHTVARELLRPLAESLDGEYRICVDSAPLRERYWAKRAGLGVIGRNNQLIVPPFGSYCFIATILTAAQLPPRRYLAADFEPCGDCRRCVDTCPGRCLKADGSPLDARSCLSYLTIEHRGPLPHGLRLHSLYGCDLCQQVCPHNATVRPTPISAFHPSPELCALTRRDVAEMSSQQFSAIFGHSAVKRTKLAGLQRNLLNLI